MARNQVGRQMAPGSRIATTNHGRSGARPGAGRVLFSAGGARHGNAVDSLCQGKSAAAGSAHAVFDQRASRMARAVATKRL